MPHVERNLRVLAAAVAELGGQARPGQQRMVRAITAHLDEQPINAASPTSSNTNDTETGPDAARVEGGTEAVNTLAVQAGTGTGKSLGYLIPALAAAAAESKRTVISTSTLALQRQILTHDAPLAARHIATEYGHEPEIALLKGWNNYVCRHKMRSPDQSDDDAADNAQLELVPDAGRARGAGARDELSAQVRRLFTWANETTTGDRDDLPRGVSDRAWRQVSINRRECLGRACPLLAECFAVEAREAAAAADVVITNHAMVGIAATGNPVLPERDALILDEAHDLPDQVRSGATMQLSHTAVERVGRVVGDENADSAAARDLSAAAKALSAALDGLEPGRFPHGPNEELASALNLIAAGARRAQSELKDEGKDLAKRVAARAAVDDLGEIAAAMAAARGQRPELVTWYQHDEGQTSGALWAAPLDVAGPIAHNLLDEGPTVLTSATLALGGSFHTLARSVGATEGTWAGIDVGTPFDYARQAIVYTAAHLPRPAPGPTSEEALAELTELCQASGGGVLALFSSWSRLRAGAEHVREHTDLEILTQGEDGIGTLIETFRTQRDVSLFGTMSMWQGIDAPGPACRLVIIDRIPFARPDDPVSAARIEAAGSRGFWDVSVTHAALRMAQAAGRLIRTTSDQGVVAILDPRIATASYGRFILNSLPPMWPTTNPEHARGALQRLATKL